MEAEIFDKETILDLMVNFIPLGIILFFIAAFSLYAPWGFDVRGFVPMIVIMVVMFIALAVLTYVSAKAIAGDEKTKPVYAQGQAGLEGAKPRHQLEAEADAHGKPVESDTDADPETDVDAETETDVDAETEAETAGDGEPLEAEPEPTGDGSAVDADAEGDIDSENTDKADDDAASSA